MIFAKLAYFKVYILKILYRLIVPLIYRDKKIRKVHLKDWTTKTEKKYLARYLDVITEQEKEKQACPKLIWVCWLQGMENAPDVVKKCYESLHKYCADFDIKVVRLDNINQYVQLPDYIWKKYHKKQISNTEFSDLLRLALLAKHGGYWIDSTVLLTDAIPAEIQNAEFFAFHAQTHLKSNNWFLKASKNDLLIQNMKNLMFTYWQRENRLMNYFLYHLFFDLMVEKNQKIADKWNKVPLLYDDCYDLEYNFFTPYSDDFWNNLKQKTNIHKLSYKYNKSKPLQGTFLEKLLRGQLV